MSPSRLAIHPRYTALGIRRLSLLLVLLVGVCLGAGCTSHPVARVFVDGLNQPRGMAFDRAGDLYVAETGSSGPVGVQPTPNNHSGRVLRIAPTGTMTVVMEGLPYTQLKVNGDVGPADVAVIAEDLYVLTGEGEDNNMSRRILRAVPGARSERVANFLTFVAATSGPRAVTVGRIKANPYALVVAPDAQAFYVSDGASGRILYVSLTGEIRVFAELPDMPPLAGMAFGPDGRLYVTRFSHWPHTAGSGAVWTAGAKGELAQVASNLTMPIDVGFDQVGRMYVLEFSGGGTVNQPYVGRRGRLLRVAEDGTQQILLDRLDYPTAMIFSPHGDLYIAVGGAFSVAGQGAILRVTCAALHTPTACTKSPTP